MLLISRLCGFRRHLNAQPGVRSLPDAQNKLSRYGVVVLIAREISTKTDSGLSKTIYFGGGAGGQGKSSGNRKGDGNIHYSDRREFMENIEATYVNI